MTTFPNIEKLGLEIRRHDWCPEMGEWNYMVRASDLEALLAKCIQVYKQPKDYCTWYGGASASETASHKALLIGIEPIRKETAEDVLRLFVKQFDGGAIVLERAFIERARRVLDQASRKSTP